MQLVALEPLHAVGTLHQELIFGHLARLKLIRARAIEQHYRALGRLGAERRTLARDLFQRLLISSSHLQVQRVAINHRRNPLDLGKLCPAFSRFAIQLDLVGFIPTGTRQTVLVNDRAEFPITQCNDLHSRLVAGVFALHFKVMTAFLGI